METHDVLKKPFNDAQLELLKVLATNLSDEDMKELKKVLLEFRFKQISIMADKLLDAQGITPEALVNRAQNIRRTKYKSKIASQSKINESNS